MGHATAGALLTLLRRDGARYTLPPLTAIKRYTRSSLTAIKRDMAAAATVPPHFRERQGDRILCKSLA